MRWTAPGALGRPEQVRAFGDQFEDDRNTLVLRQAALVDVSLTRHVTRRVAAFAAAENLFDTEYDTGRTPTRTIGTPLTFAPVCGCSCRRCLPALKSGLEIRVGPRD